MSNFWTIFVFLYIYGGVSLIWRGLWNSALGIKTNTPEVYGKFNLGFTLLLLFLTITVWALVNYGMTTLLVWWIGA